MVIISSSYLTCRSKLPRARVMLSANKEESGNRNHSRSGSGGDHVTRFRRGLPSPAKCATSTSVTSQQQEVFSLNCVVPGHWIELHRLADGLWLGIPDRLHHVGFPRCPRRSARLDPSRDADVRLLGGSGRAATGCAVRC